MLALTATGPGGSARPTGLRKGVLAGPERDGSEGDGMRVGEGDWRMGGVGWSGREAFPKLAIEEARVILE